MEISSNRINPFQLPTPVQHSGTKVAPERYYAPDNSAAESHSEGRNRLSEFISHGEVIREPAGLDYAQLLLQARQAQASGPGKDRLHSGKEPLPVQRALDAYRNQAYPLESGGVELLPRIDDYV